MEIVQDNFSTATKFEGTNRYRSARMSQLHALAQTLVKGPFTIFNIFSSVQNALLGRGGLRSMYTFVHITNVDLFSCLCLENKHVIE